MLSKSIFITGCNRGIGLDMVRQLVNRKHPPSHLFASCRKPEDAEELMELAKQNENVHLIQLDVCDYNSFPSVVEMVQKHVGGQGLHLLINNAGFSPKSTRISMVTVEQMMKTYEVNTVAPLMLTKAMLPLLKNAAERCKLEGGEDVQLPAVVNMSSTLGSLENNTNGGLYPYKCSKAALNMVTRSLSADLQSYKILVTSLHPGWVRTRMGGKNATSSVEESVTEILNTLERFDKTFHGMFIQYNGEFLPW